MYPRRFGAMDWQQREPGSALLYPPCGQPRSALHTAVLGGAGRYATKSSVTPNATKSSDVQCQRLPLAHTVNMAL